MPGPTAPVTTSHRAPPPPPRRAALVALATLGLGACALHRVPAPAPGQPAHVTVMTTVVERVRRHPPREGYRLAVAPVTVNFETEHYVLGLRPEFAAAVADLEVRGGRLDPIGPPYIGGIVVRREGSHDPYDVAPYLLLRFSPVGFSPDSSRAALLLVFDCGPSCGERVGVGLRRASNGGWRLTQYRRLPTPPPTPGDDAAPR